MTLRRLTRLCVLLSIFGLCVFLCIYVGRAICSAAEIAMIRSQISALLLGVFAAWVMVEKQNSIWRSLGGGLLVWFCLAIVFGFGAVDAVGAVDRGRRKRTMMHMRNLGQAITTPLDEGRAPSEGTLNSGEIRRLLHPLST